MKQYILDHLDFSGRDIDPQTTEEKIRALESVFNAEYGWQIPRVGQMRAIEEWLMGLPSVVHIPYTYYDIEKLLHSLGVIDNDTKESRVERLVDNYWRYTANQIGQLFRGYQVPNDTLNIYAYKNTLSEAGRPTEYTIDPSDVVRINCWFNIHGNPSYGFVMSSGDTYLLIDDYGAMNGINHLTRQLVPRRKDLV